MYLSNLFSVSSFSQISLTSANKKHSTYKQKFTILLQKTLVSMYEIMKQ